MVPNGARIGFTDCVLNAEKFSPKMTTTIGKYTTRLHYQKTKIIIFVQNSIHSGKTALQIGDRLKKMKKTDVQIYKETKFQHYLDQHHFKRTTLPDLTPVKRTAHHYPKPQQSMPNQLL